jgi:hypothetical protein
MWNNWDTLHYLGLAEHGYVAAGDSRVSLVFFPLYPWLIRLTAFFARDYMAAAFIVSGFASVAAALLFRRLARCDESEEVSRNAVWFLFIFPTSFFLHIGYTESLFLALTLGCFLAARKELLGARRIARRRCVSYQGKWLDPVSGACHGSRSPILADASYQSSLALARFGALWVSRLSLAKS